VENARAVGGVEVGLELASLRAVSGWHLKPATDSDGKTISGSRPGRGDLPSPSLTFSGNVQM